MLRINNYKVAKYMRLSRDDGDEAESESIENQRDILDNYISEHSELGNAGEYIDDGYTGTNFNRPGFKKMIQDIEDGKIDCIITKDLSRFGRDHIDTGYYLERYLPANAIRYIAIGDNVDTANPDGLQFLTFKLSFNDYYAQDISNKIKSVKQRKIEKGEFQGNTAPYGYKKDTLIKNHLIPDKEATEIVKRIFDMYANKGMSTTKIAEILNKEEIKPPAVYLQIPVFMQNGKPKEEYEWKRAQISKMLQNETYIGNVVGRKFQKISHKVDKVRSTRKDEYIIVENKHEAIIDMKTWNKVQEKLGKYKKTRSSQNAHPLKEFIYCAECGEKATYRVRKKVRKNGHVWEQKVFICSNKNSSRSNCKCNPISEDEIEEKVKIAIKEEIDKISYTDEELSKIYENAEKKVNSKVIVLKKQLENFKIKLKENEDMTVEVYKDKLQKVISNDDFNIFYEKLQKEKNKLIVEIHQTESKIQEIQKENKRLDYKLIKKIANELLLSEQPTREQYSKLVEKIEFDSQKNIKVTFTFGQMIDKEELKKAV